MFLTAMTLFSSNALKYVSMSNQECKIRPVIMDINSNEPLFCLYSILIINVVAAVTILIIHMLNHEFLMLLKA